MRSNAFASATLATAILPSAAVFAGLFDEDRHDDFFNFSVTDEESDLDLTPAFAQMTVNPNRFRAIRSGAEVVTFRRVHGRFGGDTGNRKRRICERHDNDVEHRIRTRNERRAGNQAIHDGVEEYRLNRLAAKPKSSTHESRVDEQLPPNMVRASRTGHVVEVIRRTRRDITKKALSGVVCRPAVTVERVRGTLGLPKRDL